MSTWTRNGGHYLFPQLQFWGCLVFVLGFQSSAKEPGLLWCDAWPAGLNGSMLSLTVQCDLNPAGVQEISRNRSWGIDILFEKWWDLILSHAYTLDYWTIILDPVHLNLNPLYRRNVLTGCNEQRCTGRDFCLLRWKKYFLDFGVCFLGPHCRAQLISGSVLRITLGGAQVTICGLWDRTWFYACKVSSLLAVLSLQPLKMSI